MSVYDFKTIESKWQMRWQSSKVFRFDESRPQEKFYVLTMFPYPSGDRLHMGHWYQYGIMDSWSRFQKMRGKNVFQPMGYDAFGLPAENFAIKKGIHPDISTQKNVQIMTEQFGRMGVAFDWRYLLNTSKPEYYKWTQWVFLQLYKHGLAYRKNAPVNWCTSCQTVLANEQVIDGVCERCDSQVIKKDLEQWFFKITAYAQKLLDGIESLDWPEKTKLMQKNWIGRSVGSEIKFQVGSEAFWVFTTRPDTLFGCTYVVLAPEHPLVEKVTCPENLAKVKDYLAQTQKLNEIERLSTEKEKTGVPTGSFAINPINGEKIPVWVADYVLSTYGTGAVMGVPAHDERDFIFAKKYQLPIRKVVLEPGTKPEDPLAKAYLEAGTLIHSQQFDGQANEEAKTTITDALAKAKNGVAKVNYRLRDWLVSRQRYWGSPIPIVYCAKCGEVPVPEDQLPVLLPENVDFSPTGESPLKRCDSFMQTACPKCKGPGRREADTLDTFVCSSFYFLRFPNVANDRVAFEPKLTNQMLPVDRYCGGPEHACMHLLYARFINHVFYDLKMLNFSEPFPHLTHQGLVLGPDGQKMSKSRGNSVSPDPYVEEHGSDILRLCLLFGFNYVEGGPWDDSSFKAVIRFTERVWRLYEQNLELLQHKQVTKLYTAEDKKLLYRFHYTIKWVGIDTERFQFNTAIARIMELYNEICDYQRLVPKDAQNLGLLSEVLTTKMVLLAPFAPHFAEEWWEKIRPSAKSIFLEKWPEFAEEHLQLDTKNIAVMINGKLRGEISVPTSAGEADVRGFALQNERVQKLTEGKTIVKHIFVPEKLINFIIK